MSIKNQKLLYHLTSLDNCESILRHGLNSRRDNVQGFDDVADQEIITFRQAINLDTFVPFHFFAKNPFDGRVQMNYPDKSFFYICVTREYAQKHNFKVIPKHPKSIENLVLYDYLDGVEGIDWNIMDQRDYSNRECRHVCMAESLSPKTIQPQDFFCVYVKENGAEKYIKDKCLEIFNLLPFRINVNSNMFLS